MFKLIKFIPYMILTIFINSCSGFTPSAINYQNQSLILQTTKENTVALKASTLATKNINFVSLFLKQQLILLDKKEKVIYERAKTNMDYEFEPSLHRIIKYVFESKGMIPIYAQNSLYAYQLILADNRVINLIAYQGDSQELILLYGMSSLLFNKIIHKLNPDAYYAKYNVKNSTKIETKWDDLKVHFIPLVVPLAKMMGVR
jgi:hypothetical protein